MYRITDIYTNKKEAAKKLLLFATQNNIWEF